MIKNEKITKMISWGQYIHWARIQYENYSKVSKEDCHYTKLIGVSAHWLASQYVVIEGWLELKEDDKVINLLLDEHSDFVAILKKCRNAVYHFQNEIFDKRIQQVGKENKLLDWVVSLQQEFERYLFIYPFLIYGLNKSSVSLQHDYFDCIGWKPDDNISVKWIELYIMCLNYLRKNDLNEIVISDESDKKIKETLNFLLKNKPEHFDLNDIIHVLPSKLYKGI
ncbi:TPA: hypothetical protein PXP32_000819 [Yersinia enterocolitica]|nr:hypothetical protein [Yersinia enterocolitica]